MAKTCGYWDPIARKNGAEGTCVLDPNHEGDHQLPDLTVLAREPLRCEWHPAMTCTRKVAFRIQWGSGKSPRGTGDRLLCKFHHAEVKWARVLEKYR